MRKILFSCLGSFILCHAMAQNTFPASGNVGIGTTSPSALLDVGKFISDGDLGTVLARQTEGHTTGDGTYLGVRAWETQQDPPYNGKEFSLEHHFYGQLDNAINFYRGGSTVGGYMTFATYNGTEQMIIDGSGRVGIGTMNPQTRLAVNGTISAKEIVVTTSNWPDYVFEKSYKLPSLDSLSSIINHQGYLPGMPSAKDIQTTGQNLGEMNKNLLQKVEELTLYTIQQHKQLEVANKQINEQNNLFSKQQSLIKSLEKRLEKLEKANYTTNAN